MYQYRIGPTLALLEGTPRTGEDSVLVLLTSEELARSLVQRLQREKVWKESGIGRFFYEFLELDCLGPAPSPRFQDDRLQAEIMRDAFAYLVCFQITVNHIHIAHSQQLTQNP